MGKMLPKIAAGISITLDCINRDATKIGIHEMADIEEKI